MKRAWLPIVAAVLVCGAVAAGCVQVKEGDPPPKEVEDAAETAKPTQTSGEGDVLMMGRSVMYGWFDHWGWDGQNPVSDHGFTFHYAKLASPPQIGEDASAKIAQAAPGSIVFFKLCFVDFWASSESDVNGNVDECLAYARTAAQAAQERGVALILGNALPKVQGETTPALVETHQRYNDGLKALASEYHGVVVFDQYSLLISEDGSLAKGLSVSPGDSHLNDVAYDLLDAELLNTLGSLP
ncbi:MAG: hypothetical protein OEV43_08545 [Coriobacteriia bacterium]|nr:hypothetical protein [Coriobacteriia bacterium]